MNNKRKKPIELEILEKLQVSPKDVYEYKNSIKKQPTVNKDSLLNELKNFYIMDVMLNTSEEDAISPGSMPSDSVIKNILTKKLSTSNHPMPDQKIDEDSFLNSIKGILGLEKKQVVKDSFNKTYGDAKKLGYKTFIWNDKEYNTK